MKKNLLLLTIGVFSIFYLQYTFSKRGSRRGLSSAEYSLYKNIYLNRNKAIRKVLTNNPKIVNTQTKNSGRTPLLYAIEKKRINIIETFLDNNATKVDIPNNAGETPLFLAAQKGLSNIVELLIERGAKVTDNIIKVASNPEIKTLLKNAQQNKNQKKKKQ